MMKVLDQFCARGMTYNPVFNWDNIDATLFREGTEKQVGVVKVFSAMGNFGNKPYVDLAKEPIDFLTELGLLLGKKNAAAVIVKFRDKLMYWKIDRELVADQVMKRGKPYNFYKLPINLLKNV